MTTIEERRSKDIRRGLPAIGIGTLADGASRQIAPSQNSSFVRSEHSPTHVISAVSPACAWLRHTRRPIDIHPSTIRRYDGKLIAAAQKRGLETTTAEASLSGRDSVETVLGPGPGGIESVHYILSTGDIEHRGA